MKAGWERKHLGDLLQKTGSADPTKEPHTRFTYIDVSSVSNETFSITETSQLLGKDAPSRARRVVRSGDVIFATIRPTLKRIAIVPEKLDNAVCSTGYFVLRSGAEIDHRFLFYWLFSGEFQTEMEARQKGASYPAVNDSDIRDQQMPVPSLDEQRRIAALLDHASAGIATATANAQKNLTNARALFGSYLEKILTVRGDSWVDQPIGAVADTALGKMLDKQKNRGDLQPYLRNINVRWFNFNLDDLLHMRFEPSEAERYSIKRGDVVVCEGGYPGRAAVWARDETIFYQKALHRIRFKNPAMAGWLVYILYHADVSGHLKEYFTGSGIQHFTGQALKKFRIPVPPSNEVISLVERLDTIFHKSYLAVTQYERKLTALTELKQSFIRKAFAGELT